MRHHSPGPWRIWTGSEEGPIIDANESVVVFTEGCENARLAIPLDANRDLILAAPDLLLELKIVLSCLQDVDKIAPYEDDLRKSVRKAISGARALITSIETGQP